MNSKLSLGPGRRRARCGGAFIGFSLAVAAFLAVAVLLWTNREAFRAPGVGEAKAAIRTENLERLLQETEAAVQSYAVLDAAKGIYQVPIDRAIELTALEWRDPEQAKELLNQRVDLIATPPDPESFE